MSCKSVHCLRSSIASMLAATLGAFAVCAAPAVAAGQSIESQIGVASEYVGKGLGKSAGDPSVSGSFEIGGGDFYGSVFAWIARRASVPCAALASAGAARRRPQRRSGVR